MTRAVKRPRRYDSTKRREQARQNRWTVLQAARRRFLEQGYSATTMSEIAADAGLSVESVYKMFANKAGLVKAVYDISIAGDDEPVPIAEREDVRAVVAEPTPARKIEMYARHLTTTMPRSAPVTLMLRDAAAADPAAAEVWRTTREEFLYGMTEFAKNLHSTGRLRKDMTPKLTRDVLWSVNSVEMYELLVLERGWPLKRYAEFLASTLKNALLP